MLKDITLGQYFPGHSVFHRLDPRVKIIITLAFIVMLFMVKHPIGFVLCTLAIIFSYMAAKIPIKMIVKSIKPILPIVLFTAILNVFFYTGETVLVDWWIFRISAQGLYNAITMALRIVLLIAGSSLLTYTTSPIALTDAIERLLSPLKPLHFPAHELAMMMSIALRFIPTLIEETEKIMSAQKARGADLESGNLMQRAKALVPILIPLFISAFRRAEELALAMECRCYNGGENRTRMRQLKLTYLDLMAALLVVLGIVGIILLNQIPFVL